MTLKLNTGHQTGIKAWYLIYQQINSPVEIKRREVSWTLTKKLAQKRSSAGRWCWARERELDFFRFSCFPTAELWTPSLWLCSAEQLGQQLCGAVVAVQCRTDTALTFCCCGGSPWQPWSSRLAPVSRSHSFIPLFPLIPVPNRPSHLRGY